MSDKINRLDVATQKTMFIEVLGIYGALQCVVPSFWKIAKQIERKADEQRISRASNDSSNKEDESVADKIITDKQARLAPSLLSKGFNADINTGNSHVCRVLPLCVAQERDTNIGH